MDFSLEPFQFDLNLTSDISINLRIIDGSNSQSALSFCSFKKENSQNLVILTEEIYNSLIKNPQYALQNTKWQYFDYFENKMIDLVDQNR
mmetsp:Transcript_19645/g.16787  ORF Transcript_19645/g.16787 Transcript_19645/m.16787 type:complete len:90 (+) Transcript_19645:51-320(+)